MVERNRPAGTVDLPPLGLVPELRVPAKATLIAPPFLPPFLPPFFWCEANASRNVTAWSKGRKRNYVAFPSGTPIIARPLDLRKYAEAHPRNLPFRPWAFGTHLYNTGRMSMPVTSVASAYSPARCPPAVADVNETAAEFYADANISTTGDFLRAPVGWLALVAKYANDSEPAWDYAHHGRRLPPVSRAQGGGNFSAVDWVRVCDGRVQMTDES